MSDLQASLFRRSQCLGHRCRSHAADVVRPGAGGLLHSGISVAQDAIVVGGGKGDRPPPESAQAQRLEQGTRFSVRPVGAETLQKLGQD